MHALTEEGEADGAKKNAPATPLPWKLVLSNRFINVLVIPESFWIVAVILPVYLLTAAEGFNEFSIPAYVNFMVLDFVTDIHHDETKLGYYSGLLGAAIFLGTFLTSFIWGRAADKFGRRRILLMGAGAEVFCILLFGFSQSYWWAVVIRFISGLLNGNLGVTKTFLAEITDSSNQAAAFTGWTIAEVVAGIIGAMLGGYLCQPAVQYPHYFSHEGLFGQYPYLLVNLISFTLMLAAYLVSWFNLVESSEYARHTHEFTAPHRPHSSHEADTPLTVAAPFEVHGQEDSASESDNENDNDNDLDQRKKVTRRPKRVRMIALEVEEEEPRVSAFEHIRRFFASPHKDARIDDGWSLWRDTPALLSAILYSLIGLCYTTYEFVFLSWTAAPVAQGGLSFTPTDVGNLGAFGGAFYIVTQLSAYFFILRFGLTSTLRWGLVLTLFSFLALPCTNFVRSHVSSTLGFWAILLSLHFMRQLTSAFSYGGVMQMIQNSVLPIHVGTLNGFAQSLVAFNRAAGPSLGTSLLAWSFNNKQSFPFDFFFTFLLLALVIAVCLVISVGLPARIDVPLKEQLALLPPSDSSHNLLHSYKRAATRPLEDSDKDARKRTEVLGEIN